MLVYIAIVGVLINTEHARQTSQFLGIEEDMLKTSRRIFGNLNLISRLTSPRPVERSTRLIELLFQRTDHCLQVISTVVEMSMADNNTPPIARAKLMSKRSVYSRHIQRDTRTSPFPPWHPNPIQKFDV